MELWESNKETLRTLEEVVEFHNMLPNPLPSLLLDMRIRPNRYYTILCEMKDSQERIEIDDAEAKDVVLLVSDTFEDRFKPTKDENGKYKKNIPYTKLKVICFDKKLKQNWSVTHGNIYNLSPSQVKERILKAMKQHTRQSRLVKK